MPRHFVGAVDVLLGEIGENGSVKKSIERGHPSANPDQRPFAIRGGVTHVYLPHTGGKVERESRRVDFGARTC